MHEAKIPITSSCVSKYTVEKADSSCQDLFSVIYWSNEQLPIAESKQKRIIFCSDYGTGKSILLQHHALKILREISELEMRSERKQKHELQNGPLQKQKRMNPDYDEPMTASFKNKKRDVQVLFAVFVLKNGSFFQLLKQVFLKYDGRIKLLGLSSTSKLVSIN